MSSITGSPKAARTSRGIATATHGAHFCARGNEREAHQNLAFGGRELPTDQPHLPHFGIVVATCERGDLRLSPNGVLIHGIERHARGRRCLAVSAGPARATRSTRFGLRFGEGRRCVHDARWGRATVEVVLAILQSSANSHEVVSVTARQARALGLDDRIDSSRH